MVHPFSQYEYVTYAENLKVMKKPKITSETDKIIKEIIKEINQVHQKLMNAQGSDECTSLVQRKYLKCEKAMRVWNKTFPKLQIHLLDQAPTPVFAEDTADGRALTRYGQLLSLHPKLNRPDQLNDSTKGVIEIFYNQDDIERVRKLTYEKTKDPIASRIGVVMEDRFWIWIRDAVRSPSGAEHTFNRIVSKADLNENPGAAVLPIQTVNGVKMISLQLAFRYATNSWEWEIPRGGSKPGETSEETARREIREETGFELKNLVALGSITPDSGLTASVVPIFLGDVSSEGEIAHDKTEAIQGKYLFSIEGLKEGLKKGSLSYNQDGISKEAPLRDPFLNTALLQAIIAGKLKL
jgi:ADP-ribose pyrophosphatase